MSESAFELSVTSAREHLADVVNRAAYSGAVTYLTRRGRRVAAVVPAALAEDSAARPAGCTVPERRLGFVALGASSTGRTARDADAMLAEGFGRA
jgi:prevent-host-death family protein